MYVIRCVLPCKEAKLKPAKKVSSRTKFKQFGAGGRESEEIMLMDWSKMFRKILTTCRNHRTPALKRNSIEGSPLNQGMPSGKLPSGQRLGPLERPNYGKVWRRGRDLKTLQPQRL